MTMLEKCLSREWANNDGDDMSLDDCKSITFSGRERMARGKYASFPPVYHRPSGPALATD